MSDNNNSTIKVILWGIFLSISVVIIMSYAPLFKERLQKITTTANSNIKATITSDTAENKKVDPIGPDVFSEYEIKGDDIIINSYLDGIVFNSSGNYIVKVLKDDMGYILATVGENGVPSKEFYFVGKGWFNMTTKPTISSPPKETKVPVEQTTTESEKTLDKEPLATDTNTGSPPLGYTKKKYNGIVTVTSP